MPGIVGFVPGGGGREERCAALNAMRELITHRPFSVRDPLFCDDSLCATRSHPGVIQRAPQPYSADGVHVWLDGEIFNRAEVAARLGAGSEGDPQLLAAVLRAGPTLPLLREIDGIYAAVVYDSARRRVHLVSDRHGLRHLYLAAAGGALAWASEMKAFLALPGFRPRVDRQAVDDFFAHGHLKGSRTWFEGVELLPPATLLTREMESGAERRECYWSWAEVPPLPGGVDEREIADELGRRFRRAVERRARAGGRVGVTLSGGLDSRAILAAIPEDVAPVHALTFGRPGCDDVRIAAAAARIRGARHHTSEIHAENWFRPRVEGVWWSDGQLSPMHMHGIESLPRMRELFDVNLHGFLGDALLGGSYLDDPAVPETERARDRGRRFIRLGQEIAEVYVESRLPFFDNDLLELTLAVPARLRRHSRIYNRMLLRSFPEYFRTLPWQKTGVPISWPAPAVKAAQLWRRAAGRAGLPGRSRAQYTDYARWVRRAPVHDFFRRVLESREALYPEYLPREEVRAAVAAPPAEPRALDRLFRFLGFELWLQQVFEGRYRRAEG